jgi:hypothetical protein
MPNFIRFRDDAQFKVAEVSNEVKDYYASLQPGQTIRPLLVKIAATHAGKITRNNGMYLPTEMKSAVSSWTAQYPKPVLVHHNDTGEPIGRVVSAQYVDLGNMMRDTFAPKFYKEESERNKFVDMVSKISNGSDNLIDLVRDYLFNNSALLEDPDYEGLGYIEITAKVTDIDAIQKLLDGRYATGSIGATARSAICSICKQDWASDSGMCDHRPGKTYEGKKAVLMAGGVGYEEYSFVNMPADRHSRVLELNFNGVQDFVNMEEGINDMPDKVQSAIVVLDSIQTPPDPLKVFWGDEYDAIVGNDPWGVEYAKMLQEGLEDNKEDTEFVKTLKEKKLSSSEREKMPASTFCGPNRSFPIPDCSHARVGMAYAKKYNKGASVIACIKRKAARLGCPFSSDKSKDSVGKGDFAVEYFDRYEDLELQQLFNGIRDAMEERGLSTVECDSLMDRIKELEVAQTTPNDQIETLQNELKVAYTNLQQSQEAHAELVEKVRHEKETYIINYTKVKNPTLNEKEFVDQVQKLSIVDLDKMITDAFNPVMPVIIPTTTIENPVLQNQDSLANKQNESMEQQKRLVMQQYNAKAKVSKLEADRWLEKVQQLLGWTTKS